MSSREQIIKAIQRQSIDPVPLPSMNEAWTQYQDLRKHFAETLASVGGEARFVPDHQALQNDLQQLAPYQAAVLRVLQVDGIESGNIQLDQIDDPHDLADVDFAMLPAQFGVAENAALWVTADQVRHRAIYFITQHLCLVVPVGELVHNMHQAYERISFSGPQFGCFVSGPSKTADIEQSLVIGAHGARSLTVYLVGP